MLCHDPRVSQDRDDKVETSNPALMQAEQIRTNWPHLQIIWDRVGQAADEVEEYAAGGAEHGRIVRAGWDIMMERYLVNPDAQHPDEALLMQDNKSPVNNPKI